MIIHNIDTEEVLPWIPASYGGSLRLECICWFQSSIYPVYLRGIFSSDFDFFALVLSKRFLMNSRET